MTPPLWVLTSAQQQALDAAAVQAGIPDDALMESAGRRAAEWILSKRQPSQAVVLAGPGGNGGDALVVARMLHAAGVRLRVFTWRDLPSCSHLTQRMGEKLTRAGISTQTLDPEFRCLLTALPGTDILVDGLFGSGCTHPLTGRAQALVRAVADQRCSVVSLDVPSGLVSDTGQVVGAALHAEVTLAMGFTKLCHWLYPAASFCGDIQILPLDYPDAATSTVHPTAVALRPDEIAARLPGRVPTGHKGNFGRVLVVAGSQGMTGAAILSARGALRAGAGLVTIALPQGIARVVQAAVPEALTLTLPDERGCLVDSRTADHLQAALEATDALAIGPGLGRDDRTLRWVRDVLQRAPCSMVVDADALYALSDEPAWAAGAGRHVVLTPHPGEMAALTGIPAEEVDAQRVRIAAEWHPPHALSVLILKGRPTIVRHPGGQLFINPTGNTGLATGGSGDVLTGMVAGFIAGGCHPTDAALVGAYIHGAAADRWSLSRAERSMTPTDLLEELPYVIKEMQP